MELQQGGNAAVGSAPLRVSVEYAAPSGVEVDVSAYLLGEDGRVRGDHDMVFYNQPEGAGGAVRLVDRNAGTVFEVEPERLPKEIVRLVFCVTVDGTTVAALSGARIVVRRGVEVVASFAPSLAGASEAAMIFGELYLRGGEWKLRAVGQGFDGGLAPLARSFGITVDDAPASSPSPATPPAASVNLSKISLDKPGQSVNLGKKGAPLGEVVINLKWSRRAGADPAGKIDLDLAAFWELRDGEIGVIQALGNLFGAFDTAPYSQLDRDDREGDGSKGETIRINGTRSKEIKRILIYTYIYAGVPNWAETDGIVTINAPGQPEIEVRLTDGRGGMGYCGIVMIESDGDGLKVTRVVQYYPTVHALDAAFDWRIPWGAPRSKDE